MNISNKDVDKQLLSSNSSKQNIDKKILSSSIVSDNTKEYTFDPWNLKNTINITVNGEYIFIGPNKIIKNNKKNSNNDNNNNIQIERYNITTRIIIKNNGNIEISSVDRGESGYKIFEILLKPNLNAHIENISKTKFYSGSDIMIFVLQILYRLNVKLCSLKDSSYIDCKRNNFFKTTDIPLKIVKLLQKGNTFYGLFGFLPIDKTNKTNRLINIKTLVGNLYNISWNELDNIIKKGKEQIDISINNGKNMNYNRFIISNINKWKKYWIAIYNSWIKFKNKYESISLSPFRAFMYFNEDNCSDFIGWLELYSYTFNNYNKIIYYNFEGKRFDIPNIKTFNQLKEIINNVEWINKIIVPQQDTFIVNN